MHQNLDPGGTGGTGGTGQRTPLGVGNLVAVTHESGPHVIASDDGCELIAICA